MSAMTTTTHAAQPQRFTVSHASPDAFRGGLRPYAAYRDLGFADATDGLVQAHVIRMVPPCDPAVVSKRHYHDTQFQMVYVLKGWFKTEFETDDGVQVHVMQAGSSWIQPPGIRHTVLGYSDDCELLEVIMPAEFATVEEDKDDAQPPEPQRIEKGPEKGAHDLGHEGYASTIKPNTSDKERTDRGG